MRKKSTIKRKELRKLSQTEQERLARLGTLADNPAWAFLQTCLNALSSTPVPSRTSRRIGEFLIQQIKTSLNQQDVQFLESLAQALSDYIGIPKIGGRPVADPIAVILISIPARTFTAEWVVTEVKRRFGRDVSRWAVCKAARALGIRLKCAKP